MSVQSLNSIPLAVPVEQDGQKISVVTLRKPNAGQLRGLKLLDLAQMDVTQVSKLLPRISAPPLSPASVADLDPLDLMSLSTRIVEFLFPQDMIDAETEAWRSEIAEAELIPQDEAGKAKS